MDGKHRREVLKTCFISTALDMYGSSNRLAMLMCS